MAYQALWGATEAVMEDFYLRCREAEAAREAEVQAAVVLQSVWRGKLQRMHLPALDGQVRTIQRFWRGYRGRVRFKAAREEKDRELRQAYFNHAATEIQRRWRGYWSRAHVHSFTARRAYLAAFAAQNAAVRRKMGDAYRAELARRAGGRKETALERFEAQAARLHHLVSTAAVPGVFGAPLEAAAGLAPLVEGLTIEEHLQRACKAQVVPALQRRLKEAAANPAKYAAAGGVGKDAGAAATPQGAGPGGGEQLGGAGEGWPSLAAEAGGSAAGARRAAAAPSAAGAGAAKPLPAPVPPASTVRQMSPYDAVKESAALQRRIDRAQVAVLHKQPFLGPSATISAPFIESPPTIRSADAYSDPVVGAISGARSPPPRAQKKAAAGPAAAGAAAGRPPGCGGATGRLFDASGRRRGFFDPNLRQGY